jgi:hypothetical protein
MRQHADTCRPLILSGPRDGPIAAELAGRRCTACGQEIGFASYFWFAHPMRRDLIHASCLVQSARVNGRPAP